MDDDLRAVGKIVLKVQEQLGRVNGQSLALMAAVTSMVMTHPDPEPFAEQFRSMVAKFTLDDGVETMQQGVDEVCQAISLALEHARGR